MNSHDFGHFIVASTLHRAHVMATPRTCHCGHKRGDREIHEEPEYTTWGWIMLSMFGMTPRPDYIAFRCVLCRKEVGQSRDPKLLHRKSLPEKKAA